MAGLVGWLVPDTFRDELYEEIDAWAKKRELHWAKVTADEYQGKWLLTEPTFRMFG